MPSLLRMVASAALAATAIAQANYSPNFGYIVWFRGQSATAQPLTEGWEFARLDKSTPPAGGWEAQLPATRGEYDARETGTVLQASQPGQAVSLFFSGPNITLWGGLQAPAISTPAGWDGGDPNTIRFVLDGRTLTTDDFSLYNLNRPAAQGNIWFAAPKNSAQQLQNTFHNLTIVTGPQLNGATVQFLTAHTQPLVSLEMYVPGRTELTLALAGQ